MPIRLPYLPVALTAGSVLSSYWAGRGFWRPAATVFLVNSLGDSVDIRAQVDTAADFTVFDPRPALLLGHRGPFRRQVPINTAGTSSWFTMPDDGVISLFVTDFRTHYCFLPAPPLGFWPTTPSRSVLGLTGFLDYFDFRTYNDGFPRPEFELTELTRFPGVHGNLPPGRLLDVIRAIRLAN